MNRNNPNIFKWNLNRWDYALWFLVLSLLVVVACSHGFRGIRG